MGIINEREDIKVFKNNFLNILNCNLGYNKKSNFKKSKIIFLLFFGLIVLPNLAFARSYTRDYYAKNFYSSLTWQNNTLLTNIFDNIQRVDLSKTILVGVNHKETLIKDEYNFGDSNIYFGFSKKFAYVNKIAFLVLLSKSDIDLVDNYGSRGDKGREVAMILQHKHYNNTISKAVIFAGLSETSLDRKSQFGSPVIYKPSYENRFIGAYLSSYKIFHASSVYFKPEFDLYFSYLAQGGIDEDGDMGVSIAKRNFFSLKPKINFELGKNFIKTNSSTLNIAINAGLSYELADPNKSLESTYHRTDKTESIQTFDKEFARYNFGGSLNYVYRKLVVRARIAYSTDNSFADNELTYGFNIGSNF